MDINKPDFNPRTLQPFDRWVYESLVQILIKLEKIQQQMPDPRDYRQYPDLS